MAVRLEQAGMRRADMMQHENVADAAEDRLQDPMGATEIQRVQTGADHRIPDLLHHMTEQLMLSSDTNRNN